ncbi:hypothetical protein HYFRA_00010720 [Hymenoscyphus fraxineus]|uniref:Uncharacterized protein n=1 Tax=Hymenoscyphus fraxineus TaxID=746836 RepID=A0A9N9L5C0_9HELO|nr:hypothetical protein HYFRA_00010720 [Hymenoscyphus fraxineus]
MAFRLLQIQYLKTPRDVPLLRRDMQVLIPSVVVAKVPSQAHDISAVFPHTLIGWSVYDNGLRTSTYMHTNFIFRAIHSAKDITAGDNGPLVL